ncbi:hypothetical protein H7H51_19905, partial [Mycolicibacterium farcinogenes]|nr:hypothetical protein [Mycolicibacterium farcinogenes]
SAQRCARCPAAPVGKIWQRFPAALTRSAKLTCMPGTDSVVRRSRGRESLSDQGSALALALTVHGARRGLTFSLTWWSFTFPVGTCVTGASALAAATGAVVISWLAVGLYVLLLAAWATVATNTIGGLRSGRLLRR